MGIIIKLIVQGVIASLIRLWLVTSEYKKLIADRVEISTPLNAWKRVTEGVHLLIENANPYEGDLIHEPPLNLHIYKYFIQFSQDYLHCVFILCDIITASFLYLTASKYLNLAYKQQCVIVKENKEYAEKLQSENDRKEDGDKKVDKENDESSDKDKLFLSESTITLPPTYVFAAYLFNPYVIFNCVAMTTTVFSNLYLAVYLCLLVHKRLFSCCFILAMSASQTLYSVTMIFPILLNLNEHGKVCKVKVFYYIMLFFSFLTTFQYVCYLLSGDWSYIENTYGFILLIPDLQPNIGLFWYFFTEMFEHFRALFISAFQINVAFLYLIPLSIRFRKDPVLLACSLIILTAIFKSYPSLGDIGFCLSLIPIWTYLFSYLQQGFIVTCNFLVTTVLGPIVWHLWIYSRSANANFYFGVTLSFATAQIFLITDLLFAYIKTDFWLKNSHVRNIESDTARLTLE